MSTYPVADGLCPCCGRAEPVWTPAAILAAIQAWAELHHYAPTAEEWRHAGQGWPKSHTVRKVFGTFDAAVDASGARSRKWTRAKAREALLVWVFQHGRVPVRDDWALVDRDRRRPSRRQVERLFGTWTGFLEDAGYGSHRRFGSARPRSLSARLVVRAA